MLLSRKHNLPALNIQLDGSPIPQVTTHKHLGVVLNSKLSWADYTTYIRKKAAKKIGLLRRLRHRLPLLSLGNYIWRAFARPGSMFVKPGAA